VKIFRKSFSTRFHLGRLSSSAPPLPIQAIKQRLWLEQKLHKIVFRLDATTHEQYGNKMEGVEWNYKKIKGLSSQMLFDDKGFCYEFNLRAGAVHTSVGGIEMLENAFNVVPKDVKKFLVADSGYANLDMYNHLGKLCYLSRREGLGITPEELW
jgi:hypothetical protein